MGVEQNLVTLLELMVQRSRSAEPLITTGHCWNCATEELAQLVFKPLTPLLSINVGAYFETTLLNDLE